MSDSTTFITGQETMWGAAKNTLTPDEIKLINASPLLVSELNDYQSAVDKGVAKPLGVDLNGLNGLQTVNSGGVLQSQFGINILEGSQETFVGDLSYEIGHFENFSNDRALYNEIANLDPSDPQYSHMAGVVGTIAEAESEANNYVVQQQILNATGSQSDGPVKILLNGNSNSGGTLQSTLDAAYATEASNGVDVQQSISDLTTVAEGIAGTVPFSVENGIQVNFFDYYSEHALDVHDYFDQPSISVSGPQSGVQGTQMLDGESLSFNYDSTDDALKSVTINFASGNKDVLSFSGSQLGTAVNMDAAGNVVSTDTYTYRSDGSEETELTNFASGGSQELISSGLGSGVVSEIDRFAGANASGALLSNLAVQSDGSRTVHCTVSPPTAQAELSRKRLITAPTER